MLCVLLALGRGAPCSLMVLAQRGGSTSLAKYTHCVGDEDDPAPGGLVSPPIRAFVHDTNSPPSTHCHCGSNTSHVQVKHQTFTSHNCVNVTNVSPSMQNVQATHHISPAPPQECHKSVTLETKNAGKTANFTSLHGKSVTKVSPSRQTLRVECTDFTKHHWVGVTEMSGPKTWGVSQKCHPPCPK